MWAIDARGQAGPSSQWREFVFYQTRPAARQPVPFRDPATGAQVRGADVVGPKLVYGPTASYPPAAQRDRVTGLVQMEVIVGANGRVDTVTVTQSLRRDLDESAAAAVKTWRYEPAREGGQPVPARITVTMTFNLQK